MARAAPTSFEVGFNVKRSSRQLAASDGGSKQGFDLDGLRGGGARVARGTSGKRRSGVRARLNRRRRCFSRQDLVEEIMRTARFYTT